MHSNPLSCPFLVSRKLFSSCSSAFSSRAVTFLNDCDLQRESYSTSKSSSSFTLKFFFLLLFPSSFSSFGLNEIKFSCSITKAPKAKIVCPFFSPKQNRPKISSLSLRDVRGRKIPKQSQHGFSFSSSFFLVFFCSTLKVPVAKKKFSPFFFFGLGLNGCVNLSRANVESELKRENRERKFPRRKGRKNFSRLFEHGSALFQSSSSVSGPMMDSETFQSQSSRGFSREQDFCGVFPGNLIASRLSTAFGCSKT